MQREKNIRIGLEVSIVDRLNQLLSDFNNFLFASYNTRSQNINHHRNWSKNAVNVFQANVGLGADKGNLTSNQLQMGF